jgi:transposase
VLTPGQAHDTQGFSPLFRMLADRIEALLADRGYDADVIRDEIAKAGVEAVIPAKANRRNPAPHDPRKYRLRNLVERLFNKLKNWRRVATRYDKTRESYLGFVALASIKLWLPFVHGTQAVRSSPKNGSGRMMPASRRVAARQLNMVISNVSPHVLLQKSMRRMH